MDQEVCLYCATELKGRSDKKYCDDTCRARHHNKTRRKSEQMITAVNKQARKNRRILKTLSPQGKATIRKSVLDEMGFDFYLFTSLYKSKKQLYYLIYDFGFSPIIDHNGIEKIVIIKRQPYMKNLGFEMWRS